MNKTGPHPVDLIVAAFAAQEGWFNADPNVTPRFRNNPIDLMFAGQILAKSGSGGIATFPNPASGIVAAYRQVWLWVQMDYTLTEMVTTQAPPNENNTAEYLANVLAWTGLPADVPIKQLLPGIVDIRTVIA